MTALLGLKQKFDGDGNPIYSFDTFKALKNAEYRAGDEQTLPDIDTMIDVPSVPLKCKPDTHQAKADLEAFIEQLATSLKYEGWLESVIATCCDMTQ